MNHRHWLIALALAFTPLVAAAQSAMNAPQVAVWISTAEFEDVTFTSIEETRDVEFEEDLGYGVSLNQFWTDRFSTELAAHWFTADREISLDGAPPIDGGEIDTTAITAIGQWHFRRTARFRPYVGAGLAYMRGDFSNPDSDETVESTSTTTWAANFGANIGITERIALALDAKFIRWEDHGGIDPAVLSAGLRFGF